MQFKTVATLAIASLAIAAPIADGPAPAASAAPPAGGAAGGAAQGQSGTTVVDETQAGSKQSNNPLGPFGALAAAIFGCFQGWAGGI